MKTLAVQNKNLVFVLSTNHTSVHLYENESRKLIIRSPCAVTDYSIITDHAGDWILYCLTSEGQLFKVNKGQIYCKEQGFRNHSEEDDIFSDLLTTDADDPELSLSTELVYQVTSVNLVHTFDKDNVVSLCVNSHVLVIVVHHLHFNEVNLFSGSFYSTEVQDFSQKRVFILNVPKTVEHFNILPKTFYVVTDSFENDNVLSCDHIRISVDLFKSLFGSEPLLLHSPVVLFCPIFGSVFYVPVKAQNDKHLNLTCQTLTLFCETSKPVTGIKCVNFCNKWNEEHDNEDKNRKQHQDGLFLITSDGKCLLVSSWNKHETHFVPVTVPGPVECFSIHGNFLYHSTGKDLIEAEISVEVDDDRGIVTASIINQTNLGLCNVQNLVSLQNQTLVEGTPCLLFCQTIYGHCMITSPDTLKHMTKSPDIYNPGQQIKDILLNLEKCHDRREKLKMEHKLQSSFINQLSTASFLICSKNKEVFVHHFSVRYVPQSAEFELNYTLTNQSKICVSHDWKLLLSIRHTDSSKIKTVVYSLPHGLKPSECIAILAELPDQNIYLPFEVQIQLQLEIPDQLGIHLETNSSNILPVILTSEILDIIHFVGDGKYQTKYVNKPLREIKDVVKDLAESRPISKCLLNQQEGGYQSMEPVTIVVNKSLSILTSDKIRTFGQDELAVLKYILRDSNQITEIASRAIPLSVCGGSNVHIDVSIDEYVVVTVQSTDLPLCAAVRMAILRRMQVLEKTEDRTVSLSKLQISYKQYDELFKELQLLEERLETEQQNETTRHIVTIYRKLRQLQHLV